MNLAKLEIKLQHFLDDIPEPKTSKRMDCPSCGGQNTFSITNLGTMVLFYCFRASCNFKGKRYIDVSTETLKKGFQGKVEAFQSEIDLNSFLFIPETIGRERINNYLHDNNCWDAYREGRADIRYDPKEDRVVFMLYSLGLHPKIVGAIGRKLSGTGQKWNRYGKSTSPFICFANPDIPSKTLVIVEDCCSACAVSS